MASDGLPYQFDTLQLVGQATGDQAIDTLMGGQPLPLAPNGTTGERKDALPLYLDLVDLSAASSSAPSPSAPSPSSSPNATTTSARG